MIIIMIKLNYLYTHTQGNGIYTIGGAMSVIYLSYNTNLSTKSSSELQSRKHEKAAERNRIRTSVLS